MARKKHYSIVFGETASHLCLCVGSRLTEIKYECRIGCASDFLREAEGVLRHFAQFMPKEEKGDSLGNLVIVVPAFVSINAGYPASVEPIRNLAKEIYGAKAVVIIDELDAASKRMANEASYQGEILVLSALESGIYYRRYNKTDRHIAPVRSNHRIENGVLHRTSLDRAVKMGLADDYNRAYDIEFAQKVKDYIVSHRGIDLDEVKADGIDSDLIEKIFDAYVSDVSPWPGWQTCRYIVLAGAMSHFCLLHRRLNREYGDNPSAKNGAGLRKLIGCPRECGGGDYSVIPRYYSAVWARSEEAFPFIGINVSAILVSEDGQAGEVTLADENDTKESLAKPQYKINKVCAVRDDSLTIKTETGERSIPVSDLFTKESPDVLSVDIGVSFSTRDNSVHICIQASNGRTVEEAIL